MNIDRVHDNFGLRRQGANQPDVGFATKPESEQDDVELSPAEQLGGIRQCIEGKGPLERVDGDSHLLQHVRIPFATFRIYGGETDAPSGALKKFKEMKNAARPAFPVQL